MCGHLAYVEANPQTPLAGTHHCEDPPFLPSVKGPSLGSGGTWGGPQEMAFLRAAAGSFRAYTWAAHAHSGSQAHAFLGSPDPPFRGHSSSTGSLGTCLWTQEPPCHLEDHAITAGEHCPEALLASHRHCAQDRLVDQGPGRGIFQGTLKGQVPSVAQGVPTPSLHPAGHYHPAISSPLPPRGSDTWALCAST